MKNIAIVSFKYPPIYSGYGKQLNSVTQKILSTDESLDLTLLTAYEESQVKQDKFEVIPLLDKDDVDSRHIYPFAFKLFIWLLFNAKKYSVIHCVKAGPEAVVCNIISKILNKPLIVKVAQDELSERELKNKSTPHQLYTRFKQKLLSRVDHFIAISDQIESDLLNIVKNPKSIIRIPNGVDTNRFTPASQVEKEQIREELEIPEKELVVLYVGSLTKRKGTHDLLNALENIKSYENARCILCGPILENKEVFLETIDRINDKGNVLIDYRGEVNNPQEYMKAADVFILPSYSEGLPNVLLEAGSTGLPLVTTNIGGSQDILVNEKNGYIVDTASPDAIREKVEILLDNKDIREKYGKYSRKYILDNFSLEYVSNRYKKLYKKL